MEAFPHDDQSFDYIYKSKEIIQQYKQIVVLSGDAGVGKSNILQRYVKGIYHPLDPTIGVQFATKTITLPNHYKIKAQIWDTSGSERYRAITKGHYRKAVGALLVYDVTNYESFENLGFWLEQLQQNADQNLSIALMGNKCDLLFQNENMRMVQKQQAIEFANQNNLIFIDECSALADIGIRQSIEGLIQNIYDIQSDLVSRGIKDQQQLKLTFQQERYKKAKNSSCCY